jgi:tetratricopeptide (TPR) repeat protein
LYHKNNRIEDALSSLDAAIDIDKNFGDAFNIKGQILLEQNKKDESDKYLETAKQLNNSRNRQTTQP